jgi:peptide/nickel transport system ATP-binding protein
MTHDIAQRLTPAKSIAPLSEKLREHWSRQKDRPQLGTLLRIADVTKRYSARAKSGGGTLAVNAVSLQIDYGECLGLVGESGCGKSTLCKMIMGATRPDGGEIELGSGNGLKDINAVASSLRHQRIQYVFQDPFGSLNPRRTVRQAILEPFEIHQVGTAEQRQAWAHELIEMVGLRSDMLDRYPNAFSGGQRQRVAIARALALKPDLLVCDEPVSALDVSVQAQILNMLQDVRRSLGMAFLFVSHNLAVIRHVSDRVAVMCRGRIVEMAPAAALFADPRHPYTKALMAAAPDIDPDRKLDLTALNDGRASDPETWDPPYRLLGDAKARYETVSQGHVVAVAQ